jgi:hypothetical protein
LRGRSSIGRANVFHHSGRRNSFRVLSPLVRTRPHVRACSKRLVDFTGFACRACARARAYPGFATNASGTTLATDTRVKAPSRVTTGLAKRRRHVSRSLVVARL